jgi:hypothetical protein
MSSSTQKPKLNVIPYERGQSVGYRVNWCKALAVVPLTVLIVVGLRLITTHEFFRGGFTIGNVMSAVFFIVDAGLGHLGWVNRKRIMGGGLLFAFIPAMLFTAYVLDNVAQIANSWSVLLSMCCIAGIVACYACIALTSWYPPHRRPTENWGRRKRRLAREKGVVSR